MGQILVRGGSPLHGAVAVSGSKNASLPILCAALLNEQPVVLRNVPDLEDVSVIGRVLESLGASFTRNGDGLAHVDARNIGNTEPPYELVNRMRASFLVLGPLLARFGEASVPLPGGCEIGARPVGEHLQAMRALGAEITQEGGLIHARASKLVGAEIYFDKPSVGATENALMAATLAEGVTVLHNAAMEPEVIDLCHFLTRCGVKIDGVGQRSITVHGQTRLSAHMEYSVIPDRIEAGTYLLAIIGTGGEGTVHGARPDHLEALVLKLRECGVHVDHGDDWIEVRGGRPLRPAQVTTDVYPGFPTDLQAQMISVLTAAHGVSTVDETIFEHRLKHVPELIRMGAHIRITGETAIIEGTPGGLTAAPVEAHDLRGAAALVIAGLMATGESRIDGLRFLLRGYERMPEKFAQLGGHVVFDHTPVSVSDED
jgi:UDP-N-acetylglucosamine 1-carboxyvinyltransferase